MGRLALLKDRRSRRIRLAQRTSSARSYRKLHDSFAAGIAGASAAGATLKLGMSGEDVKELQIYLNTHGSPIATTGPGSPGNETTYFGSATRAALAKFQTGNGIAPAQGYFGPTTRAFIARSPTTTTPAQLLLQAILPASSSASFHFTSNLMIGEVDDEVKDLQIFLNGHGFIIAAKGAGSPGNETTTFGMLTYRALIKFQKSQGLPQTGYLGPLTRAALAAFE